MPTGPRFIGSPRPWAGACFHARAHTRIDRPPDVRRLVSFLRVAYRLFRAPSRQPPPVPFRVGLTAWVSAVFATSPGGVHIPRGVQPRFVPSSGFHSLSTAFSAPWLRGLFHPRAAYTVHRPVQGLLAPRSASALVGRRCPPAVRPPLTRPALRPDVHQAEASTSRPLSARSSVRTGSVMSLADGRSPPRVRLLQVPCASDGSAASPRSSAHGVHLRQPSLARSPTTIASSVSPPRTGYVCLQTHRPAREFRA